MAAEVKLEVYASVGKQRLCYIWLNFVQVALTTIFFDAGGTIVYPDPALTLAALAERRLFPTEAQLHAAEREAKRQFDDSRADDRSVDTQYWDLYYLGLF